MKNDFPRKKFSFKRRDNMVWQRQAEIQKKEEEAAKKTKNNSLCASDVSRRVVVGNPKQIP